MSFAPPRRLEAGLWLATALGLMAGIFVLSSGRIDSPLPRTPWSSFATNCAHFPLFGLLAASWRLFLGATGRRGPPVTWIAVAIATLYGISDEIHQSFVDGRTASAFDVVTDLGGAAFGVIVAERWRSGRPRLGWPAWSGTVIGVIGAALDTWWSR